MEILPPGTKPLSSHVLHWSCCNYASKIEIIYIDISKAIDIIELLPSQCSMLFTTMDLLPDTQNCGLRMRRECRERFPCHRLQRKLC